MENHIKNNPLERLDKEYSVLGNSLDTARFGIFFGLFFYIGVSELMMDKLLNLEQWELLIRISYVILPSYLWVKYGQRKNGSISAIATDEGLYFLISEKSKLYPSLFFFINWKDIEQISLNEVSDSEGLEVKTKIPLVKSTTPLINTKIPFIKDIHLHELPENYKNISLQTASFSQPEILAKTVIIESPSIRIHKWKKLNQKFPVKIIT